MNIKGETYTTYITGGAEETPGLGFQNSEYTY